MSYNMCLVTHKTSTIGKLQPCRARTSTLNHTCKQVEQPHAAAELLTSASLLLLQFSHLTILDYHSRSNSIKTVSTAAGAFMCTADLCTAIMCTLMAAISAQPPHAQPSSADTCYGYVNLTHFAFLLLLQYCDRPSSQCTGFDHCCGVGTVKWYAASHVWGHTAEIPPLITSTAVKHSTHTGKDLRSDPLLL